MYEFADINPSQGKPIWQFLVESGDKLVRAISEALDYSVSINSGHISAMISFNALSTRTRPGH